MLTRRSMRKWACVLTPSLLVVLYWAIFIYAAGTTYYVGKSGSDANSCATAQSSTAGNRKLTINAGIGCLASGDRLVIGAGTYTEANTLYETTVSVANGFAGSPTIIEGEGYAQGCALTENCPVTIARASGTSANLESAVYITLRGFIIDDSAVAASGGNNCFRLGGTGDHVVIEDVVFRYCSDNGVFETSTYSFLTMRRVNAHHAGQNPVQPAHGGYLQGDDTWVEDSLFHDNGLVSQSNNIGVQYYCSAASCWADRATSIRNRYYNNDIGEVFDGNDSVAINDVIYDNNSDGLTTGFEDAITGFRAYNLTIVNNGGHGVYNGIFAASNDAEYINNLIVGNVGSPQLRVGASSTNVTQTTNLTTGAATDYIVSSSNFHLKAGSAAINTGTNLSAYGVSNDFDGDARPQGAAYDVGADEYIESVAPSGIGRSSKGMGLF